MATDDKKGAKAPKQSLMDLIKAKGFEVSKQKTALWSEYEILATEVSKESFDFYISANYEGSSYVIYREGTESKLIPFYKGEIDTADYESSNEKGLVDPEDVEFSIDIKTVIALRDDSELKIKKGDIVLRAFIS
jgi:hypothetical protein